MTRSTTSRLHDDIDPPPESNAPRVFNAHADRRSRPGLLASAVAGQPTPIAEIGNSSSYNDGATIHLAPGNPDEQTAAIIAQALLIPMGSLRRDITSKLVGRSAIADRYFALEVARGARTLEASLPGWFTDLIHTLVPGPASQSADESLAIARSRVVVPSVPGALGTIQPTRGLVRRRQPQSLPRRAHAAPNLKAQDNDSEGEASNEDGKRSRILEVFTNPLGGNPLLMKLFGSVAGLKRSRSEGAAGGEGFAGEVRYDPDAQRRDMVLLGARLASTPQVSGNEFSGYPEWDWTKQRYRHHWCTVRHYDPQPTDQRHNVAEISPELRRQARLLAQDFVRRRAQPWGYELDLDALVERAVRRRAHQKLSEHVYAARLRERHSLALFVLIDCSGSGKERPGERAVHDEQLVFSAVLLELLHSIGVRVAAFGFNTHGRRDVRFIRVKGFDNQYDASARQRLNSLHATGFTRLGAAVRHATQLIDRNARTPERGLLVVSDGFAFDEGSYQDHYADYDTRQALDEARLRGIGCACVSLGSTLETERLERVFGNSNHLVDPSADGALRKVVNLITTALRRTY